MTEEKDDIIVLVDSDDNEVAFKHIDTFEVNNINYVALIPLDEQEEYEDEELEDYYEEDYDDEGEDEEVVILKIVKDENDEDTLISIEDEDEFNQAYEELKIRLEDIFDFIDDDDDWV